MKKTLASLVRPSSNKTPYVVHEQNEILRPIVDLPILASLNALLNSWPTVIDAHLPDLRDEASSIETTPKDAQKFFDNGMGLLFNDVQRFSPLLGECLHAMRIELGISALTFERCLIYATPDGKGTAPHFDQNINFVLQIHGTKKWKLAPNNSVSNPLTRHTMGTMPDPELMQYQMNAFPETMPEDALSFDLKPGSFLFVPRGWWHSTEAEGDALALNFTFTAPSWIDLLTAALRGRLAQSEEWRETAIVTDVKKFDELIQSLKEDLPKWKAEDIMGVTE